MTTTATLAVRTFNGNVYSLWSSAAFFINSANDAPGPFELLHPAQESRVTTLNPLLEVTISSDIDQDRVHYDFVIYSDSTLTQEVIAVQEIAASDTGTVHWLVDTPLIENGSYTWQVTAVDQHGAMTPGPIGNFFVNTENDAPGLPEIDTPALGSYVESSTVEMQVINASDIDGDTLSYHFELDKVATFDSVDLTTSGALPETAETTAWSVAYLDEDQHYYWRIKVTDGITESGWVQGDFTVNATKRRPRHPDPSEPRRRRLGGHP